MFYNITILSYNIVIKGDLIISAHITDGFLSTAWRCTEAPQLYNVKQVDAGQGKVVVRDSSYRAYFLSGSSWYRLGSARIKHVSVGPAGMWAVDTSNRVYKYVAGNFVPSSGNYY